MICGCIPTLKPLWEYIREGKSLGPPSARHSNRSGSRKITNNSYGSGRGTNLTNRSMQSQHPYDDDFGSSESMKKGGGVMIDSEGEHLSPYPLPIMTNDTNSVNKFPTNQFVATRTASEDQTTRAFDIYVQEPAEQV